MPAATKKTSWKPRCERILKLPALPHDQFLALRDNIAVNGVLVPILVDEKMRIIDGHYRKAIAGELGYDCPEIVTFGSLRRACGRGSEGGAARRPHPLFGGAR